MSYNERRFCVYFHKDKNTGQIKYIGSGALDSVSPRPWSKAGRTKEHLDAWETLEVFIIDKNLTKEEAVFLERKYILENDFSSLINKTIPTVVGKDILYEEVKEYFEVDSSSPSWISWKLQSGSATPGSFAGYKKTDSKKIYYKIRFKSKYYLAHRIVWVLYNKENLSGNLIVDHIDGNSENNSPENLRAVSQRENNQRKSIASNNTSGTTGVSWNSEGEYWLVTWVEGIRRKGKAFNPKVLFPELSKEDAKQKAKEFAIKFKESKLVV